MFLNPKTIIEKGWLKFPEWMDEDFKKKCVQPNAIDFTLDRVSYINHFNTFRISETLKLMRGSAEKEPVLYKEEEDSWILHSNESYDCLSDFYVKLPSGVAAILLTRSSFIRNGMIWAAGLYDSGFEGHIGGVLHNFSGEAQIYKGTRIGQIIFVSSESAGLYAGGWNHAQGTNYDTSKNAT